MEININKLYRFGYVVEQIADGSVRLIRYEPEHEEGTGNATLRRVGYGGSRGTYMLDVDFPPQRKIETILIVSRTSVNCWRVVCCTEKAVAVQNFHTLGETNDFIKSLGKR